MPDLSRRRFFVGAAALFCAPAIVRASSLMPVRSLLSEVVMVLPRYAMTTDGLAIFPKVTKSKGNWDSMGPAWAANFDHLAKTGKPLI